VAISRRRARLSEAIDGELRAEAIEILNRLETEDER
jgi:hypothetical protein